MDQCVEAICAICSKCLSIKLPCYAIIQPPVHSYQIAPFFFSEVNWDQNSSFTLLPAARPEQLFELDDVLYIVETKIAGTSAEMVVDTGGWMNMVPLSYKDR